MKESSSSYKVRLNIKDSVVTFGPLAKNSEWYLVLKDQATKDKLMLASYVAVKEVNLRIRPTDSSQFIVRVHWAIPFIPSSAITKTLNELCKHTHVLSIADEKLSQKWFEGVATGVRSIVMTGDSREVPHIMHVVNPTTCETYELLLTMVGRKPFCLRCRREGHFRRDCTMPYCRHHGEYGHSAEGCAAARSYASAARGGSDDPRDREEEDEVVGEMAPPVSTQTRYAYGKEGIPSVVSAPLEAEEIALSEGESDSSGCDDHAPVWQVVKGDVGRSGNGEPW